jgi:hypothetical protein
MAIDRQDSPYRRGNRYDRLPIPMVEEHCIPVDAGAVQLVIESRRLTNAIVEETYQGEIAGGVPFDDGGATLHVLGTDDGLEHLRFDCFEDEPHYHYIDQGAVRNTVVRIDELAVGDPIEFSLACVEQHLPDMLGNCGVPALAVEVQGRMDEVHAAMKEVRALMLRAQQPVELRFGAPRPPI